MQKVGTHKSGLSKTKERQEKLQRKFKKFKRAFVAWEESDIDTSDDESSDQEVANLCLVAKKDIQMWYISNQTLSKIYKITIMIYMRSH